MIGCLSDRSTCATTLGQVVAGCLVVLLHVCVDRCAENVAKISDVSTRAHRVVFCLFFCVAVHGFTLF